jgi:ABC-type amino acid transport substrate-binding protein
LEGLSEQQLLREWKCEVITPIVAAAMVVLACFAIAFRFTPWGRRTSGWVQSLLGEKVLAEPTKFSEWVSFAGFGLTIVGVSISWYTISQQNQKAVLETRIKELTDQVSATQQRLQFASHEHDNFAPDVDIHLTAPIRDSSLVGSRITFEWVFAQHTAMLSYLIELLKVDSDPHLPLRPRTGEESSHCDFSRYRSCMFYASASNSERSELLLTNIPESEGHYLWRVVPAKKRSVSTRAEDAENVVSDWSEYGSFSYHRSLLNRVTATKNVLVGTTYSDNVNFSSLDPNGEHVGHDVDLVQLLVEGCLLINRDVVTFHDAGCQDAVADYKSFVDNCRREASSVGTTRRTNVDRGSCREANEQYENKQRLRRGEPGRLTVRFKPFPTVGAGLEALSRKEIDLFIGSLTKAQDRENDAVVLTDGYYPFRSKLCAHTVQEAANLKKWLASPRRIGVINNSTNHWFATLLSAETGFENKISVVAFDSFPLLQSAFEEREVDAVLVDGVLLPELLEPDQSAVQTNSQAKNHTLTNQDVWVIKGLEDTSASKSYHARLGSEGEEFSIAVATDREKTDKSFFRPVKDLAFNFDLVRLENPDTQMSLYEPLQLALHSYQVVSIRSVLREANNLPPPDTAIVTFPTRKSGVY